MQSALMCVSLNSPRLIQAKYLSQTDHIKRTFDYGPFLREFVKELDSAGHLHDLAGRDEKGRKLKK